MEDNELDREPDQDVEPERSAQVRSALLKAAAVIVGIAVVIALGTTLLVRGLGLSDEADAGTTVVGTPTPVQPLPTTALPLPEKSHAPTPSEGPSESPSESPSADGKPQLAATPVIARAMERVTLSGTYPGRDAMSLQVQRLEGGRWVDFPVSAKVRVGTFDTYLMTGRSGDNKFRVFDPVDKVASNPVTVTID